MRFTKKGNAIDLEKAEREIMAAFRAGVNYFDTAYLYPGSEVLLGTVLERNGIRDQVNIATKLPQYLVRNLAGAEKYFSEELERLRTGHVDYYLMHMLTDLAQWERLKQLGITDWIREKKESGAIRNIGFSFHGNTENFLKILEDYEWDFCQIQYNYLDETTQAGVKGLKAAAAKGIPVIIMEPLRGGKLVNLLPADARKAMAENSRQWSPAAWSFRWLYNQPEVTVVLSGMNSLEMVGENVATAWISGDLPLLQRHVYRRKIGRPLPVRPDGGHDPPAGLRHPVRRLRKVREALPPGDPDPGKAEGGGQGAPSAALQNRHQHCPGIHGAEGEEKPSRRGGMTSRRKNNGPYLSLPIL